MSDYRAIAGVSRTLRNLLRDRMSVIAPPPFTISIAPPDVTVSGVSGRRLNLYLFQVSENGVLKNQEIPGQGYAGAYGSPPLSLDLHYLFTAYGSSDTGADADLEAQEILGDAMRVLHDFPIVTEDLLAVRIPGNPPLLDPALLGEFEKVKITLQPVNVDELSKIWMSLPKVSFRLSVAYEISVVQIESQKKRTLALPVRERRVYAIPFRSPQITDVFLQPPIGDTLTAVAQAGETLRILGVNLRGPATHVFSNDVEMTITSLEDTQIEVTVPATIPSGVHPLQVVQNLALVIIDGQPPVEHRGFRSNAVPFMLIPTLVGPLPVSGAAGSLVNITVDPPVLSTQKVILLLGDFTVPAIPLAPGTSSAALQFRLPAAPDAIPPATYFMRVRVDGAESRLTFNNVTKQYTGPNFQVLP